MPDYGGPDYRGPDYGGPDFGGQPSMEAVLRTDSFIEALASGGPVDPQDAADAELAALLGGWRDEMRQPPATDLITESEAIAAVRVPKSSVRLVSLSPSPSSSPRVSVW